MDFVLDASVAASWAFRDENHPLAETALSLLRHSSCRVPAIWWFEIRNILVVNERRKRIMPEQSTAFLRRISRLPIIEDADRNEGDILHVARSHKLTFYDACYLELAARMRIPLATLDSDLLRAAKSESVQLLH